MKTVETQQEHRIAIEKISVDRSFDEAKLGQIFGFIIALAFLIASTYIIAIGQPVAGTILGAVDLVTLVAVFVYGRQNR